MLNPAAFVRNFADEITKLEANASVCVSVKSEGTLTALETTPHGVTTEVHDRGMLARAAGAGLGEALGIPDAVFFHDAVEQPCVAFVDCDSVAGLVASEDGAEAVTRLFPKAVWLPMNSSPEECLACLNGPAPVCFVAHAGVLISGATEEAMQRVLGVMRTLEDLYVAEDNPMVFATEPADAEAARTWGPAIRTIAGDDERRAGVVCAGWFDLPTEPFTVRDASLRVAEIEGDAPSRRHLGLFEGGDKTPANLLLVKGKALVAVGADRPEAVAVMTAARRRALVERLADSFGGASPVGPVPELPWVGLCRPECDCIAEMDGKVCLVTGAAQGFGLGIAKCLASSGATVILADMNLAGAEKAAAELVGEHGPGRAVALEVNIAEEESVSRLADNVARTCGGLDLLVANAGVLKAGSVKSLSKKDWDFVTSVNYTGYFLCVKHLSNVMAAQVVDGMGAWMDVIQINSKSGLEGSNKNGAYAGSKFGTIGLTQSFAKELVADRIKVNSICPGNYFDGPLWSHPEKGLFVQYLRTGKVPGAKSVEDVKHAYETKVPIGRGCSPADVARAIVYAVSQQYETGQAIPVTGGQVMLN